MRPRPWEGRRMRGSGISRTEQGWLRQSGNRARGPGLTGLGGALPRWPFQTEASQGGHRGFTTQEMGSARRAGGGGGERPF